MLLIHCQKEKDMKARQFKEELKILLQTFE